MGVIVFHNDLVWTVVMRYDMNGEIRCLLIISVRGLPFTLPHLLS